MQAHEVIVNPRVESKDGVESRYVAIAAWQDNAKKTANRRGEKTVTVRAEGSGVDLHAELVNDFRVFYKTQATRIKNYGGAPGSTIWRNTDTRQLVDITRLLSEGLLIPDGPYETESYSRDISAEITEAIERYKQRAAGKPQVYWGDKRGTTLNLQVSAGGNDGYSDNASWLTSGTSAFNGRYSTHDYIRTSFLFDSVSGLSGATIDGASLLFKGARSGASDLNVYLEKAESPAMPSSNANWDARTKTTEFTNVVNPTMNASTHAEYADLLDELQEVVDAGYDPTTIHVMLQRQIQYSGAWVTYYTYERNSADAAKLDLDYSVAGVTVNAPAISAAASMPGTPIESHRVLELTL